MPAYFYFFFKTHTETGSASLSRALVATAASAVTFFFFAAPSKKQCSGNGLYRPHYCYDIYAACLRLWYFHARFIRDAFAYDAKKMSLFKFKKEENVLRKNARSNVLDTRNVFIPVFP